MSFYFSKDDILHIHSKLIDDFGGSDGIRDEGMLESALNAPLQTFDSSDLYPTLSIRLQDYLSARSWIIPSSTATKELRPQFCI